MLFFTLIFCQTQEGQIVALLDWDDLHPDFLIQEVAWAYLGFWQNGPLR